MKLIKIKLTDSIFAQYILDLIKQKIYKYKIDDYYENNYKMFVYINPNDCIDFKNDILLYHRPWINNYDEIELVELELRSVINNVKHTLINKLFHINQIYVETKNDIEHAEIELEENGLYDYSKNECLKMHLNITLNNKHINKIVDLIDYDESDLYIDERNDNRTFYNSLLLRKEQGEKLNIADLSEYDWKQLILKENVINAQLEDLYDISKNDVVRVRHKFIPSYKQYIDEYFIYCVMFSAMNIKNFYSNFMLIILEQLKILNIKVIYEYLNPNYNEIIYIDEEIIRQKEIETNNLAGKKYIMPLSGIFLKKFYWAIKNKQLDRKILRNDWFNTYYGTIFFNNFVEQIEKSKILELYETGKIYESEFFVPYQYLYKQTNIKESEQVDNNSLVKVKISDSKQHINVKRRNVVPPKDHVNLAKIKSKVGRFGEELVYKYERDTLKEYPELQKKIKKVYLTDEKAGYDIESCDFNGNIIYIEVKTNKINSNKRIKFYISSNEDEFISKHENAYIYYIYDLDNPKLRVIDQKTYLSYYKKAINYEIDQDIIKQ